MEFLPIEIEEAKLSSIEIKNGQLIFVKDNPAIYLDSNDTRYNIMIAASSESLGLVQPDNDTIKINNGIISADVIGNWSAGVNYPVGYFVVYNNALYQCVTANSDSVWTESNWSPIGSKASETGMSINNWTANTEYTVGNLVINETTIYQCHTEHTSGEAFDSTNWTAMTGAKGDKGDDGFSPIVKIESTDTGATITVTDATETTTADISNGTDGITPHIDETTKHWMIGDVDTNIIAEGIDGISPKATVEQTETGATVTIISGEETTIAELTNGITPHIDETTKNWFIGEADTGVLAEGTVEINADCAVLYATFSADGWSDTVPYTQTVIVNSITSNNVPIVDIFYSEDSTLWENEKKAYGCLTKIETIDNGIIGYCLNKPENDFTVKLRIAGDVTGLTFVTQDEFNTLYEMISSANTTLENTLNGGETNG